MKRIKVSNIQELKQNKNKILMLTAYNALIANILDQTDIHIILVGDSLGNTALGYESSIPVTMQDMCSAVSSVARGSSSKLIVADMPFLSYQVSDEEAVRNAGLLIKAGAHAVKIEGAEYLETITRIIKAGIPVMGHLGFTPQSVNKLGGFKIQGKSEGNAQAIIKDAQALEEAGVFSIVLEMIPAELGNSITEACSIPTIGIGAGEYTDGQVLVTDDLIGLFDKFKPKFVKRYANIAQTIKGAVNDFCEDVSKGKFPDQTHSY